ncbi:WapI family immunity protein [Pedobacter gandavensis]|uniref:Uncharacterized protein n=1 Tax=Pedobacter gandavensis TaxID=2679963 RepID=A0ABR6F1P2_9SPHI|nr:hypothetical protein [Pedobacter gandavensis]MBB2151431.1 hypothetical protein [Pedobacter gandavensis]
MINTENLSFEISDSGYLVRLEPIERIQYNSEIDWDKNWIKTKVSINAGKFSGQYEGDFRTTDFKAFKEDLSKLYDNLNGTVIFNDLEGYLDLKIIGDGFGHFNVEVKACDNPGIYGSVLSFNMEFDQTEINKMVNQLEMIIKQLPVIGSLN